MTLVRTVALVLGCQALWTLVLIRVYPFSSHPVSCPRGTNATHSPSEEQGSTWPDLTVYAEPRGPTCNEADLSTVHFMFFTGEAMRSRALLALRTWTTRIPRGNLLIVTDHPDPELDTAADTLVVNGTYGSHDASDLKWVPGLLHMWQRHLHRNQTYRWFVVSDDDTFFFVQHLAVFLHDKDWRVPVLYGDQLEPHYFAGGAGWIASSALMEQFIHIIPRCPGYNVNPTDRMLSHCLWGEMHMDITPTKELGHRRPGDYLHHVDYPYRPGGDMGFPISFHYITGDLMRTLWRMDQLLLKPYRDKGCKELGLNPWFENYSFVGDIRYNDNSIFRI